MRYIVKGEVSWADRFDRYVVGPEMCPLIVAQGGRIEYSNSTSMGRKGGTAMPRHSAQDYADRVAAIELHEKGTRQCEIAEMLHRPARWVRRTQRRYDAQVGLDSLRDHSSRPHRCPNQTPPDIEQAVCALKQAHPGWGRRQITRQLRWRWREDPARRRWVGEKRIRHVLKRHPELNPAAPSQDRPPRQIDYLECNLIWAGDIQETRLADGTIWHTLHWLDLYSRYELGQLTVQSLTEDLVIQSFLSVAQQHGLPRLVKTDHDKLWYDASSGLPSRLTRVLTALGIHHGLVGPKQPWWNGVVERYIQTCRREVELPDKGDAEPMNAALEAERQFYNQERCHSRCQDQPPATVYQPSSRRLPPDFDPSQVPITAEPTVVTRQVQADGHISLAGRPYSFARRYAGQSIRVTVNGWSATAEAGDGWQRTWDLHPQAAQPPVNPLPSTEPKPLRRKVNGHGSISLNRYLYYVAIAWAGQTLTIQREADTWQVSLPDGSTKILPCKHALPTPSRRPAARSSPPTHPPAEPSALQTRHVTQRGQVAFHKRLYYVGIAHAGQTVAVVPTSEGLSVYTLEQAWITTCLWKEANQPDKPLGPL